MVFATSVVTKARSRLTERSRVWRNLSEAEFETELRKPVSRLGRDTLDGKWLLHSLSDA